MTELTEQEFWATLANMPEPQPISYRLYYDDHGCPVIYTMEELAGNYIEVDQKTYVIAPNNVRVLNGQLVYISPTIAVTKLQPGPVGTACSPEDVCIIVDEMVPHTKWSRVNNEIN